ncbi:hypothetical protein SAMN05216328_101422 [Ensifer sp. YR511]|jgi:hypothetical protein|nr:hypothetical protein SAMN05216328_101422 [Ensifer sp. YR511]
MRLLHDCNTSNAAGFVSLSTAPGSGVTVINGNDPNCTAN